MFEQIVQAVGFGLVVSCAAMAWNTYADAKYGQCVRQAGIDANNNGQLVFGILLCDTERLPELKFAR